MMQEMLLSLIYLNHFLSIPSPFKETLCVVYTYCPHCANEKLRNRAFKLILHVISKKLVELRSLAFKQDFTLTRILH